MGEKINLSPIEDIIKYYVALQTRMEIVEDMVNSGSSTDSVIMHIELVKMYSHGISSARDLLAALQVYEMNKKVRPIS